MIKTNQGGNSTGGLLRLTDKDGSVLKNTKFSLMSQTSNVMNKLADTTTDNNGEPLIVTGVSKGTAFISAYAKEDMGKSHTVQVDIVQ